MQRRLTKAEVDYLVADQKYVKDIPPIETEGNYKIIRAAVYRKGETVKIRGLLIEVSVPIPLPGIPADIPGIALKYHGHRIRGIDREQRHDNPDGTVVYGWHEHLYSPEYEDSLVIATQEPKHKDLRGVFKEGLKRWNIRVSKEQEEVE